MSFKTLVIAASVLGFGLVSSANALTIVNKDKTNHNVRIILATAKKGDKPVEVKIAAGASAQFDCSMGCTAHIGKKDNAKKDAVLKGTEKTLTIDNNALTAAN